MNGTDRLWNWAATEGMMKIWSILHETYISIFQ